MKKRFLPLIIISIFSFLTLNAQNKDSNSGSVVKGDFVALCKFRKTVDVVCLASENTCFTYIKDNNGNIIGSYTEDGIPKSFKAKKVRYSTFSDVEGKPNKDDIFYTLDSSKRFSTTYSSNSQFVKSTIFLVNHKGKVKAKSRLKKGKNNIEFDLSNKKVGRYFVRVVDVNTDGNKQSYILKIIDLK